MLWKHLKEVVGVSEEENPQIDCKNKQDDEEETKKRRTNLFFIITKLVLIAMIKLIQIFFLKCVL